MSKTPKKSKKHSLAKSSIVTPPAAADFEVVLRLIRVAAENGWSELDNFYVSTAH